MKDFLHVVGERIIQSMSGLIDIGTLDVLWKPGNLHLTNKRVLFECYGRIQFATRLEDVVDVRLEMRRWILQHIRQLCISYRGRHSDLIRMVYIVVKAPVDWQKLIKDRMTLMLLEE
jgi:hypothetical protein